MTFAFEVANEDTLYQTTVICEVCKQNKTVKFRDDFITVKCKCRCCVIYSSWKIKVIPYKTFKQNKYDIQKM